MNFKSVSEENFSQPVHDQSATKMEGQSLSPAIDLLQLLHQMINSLVALKSEFLNPEKGLLSQSPATLIARIDEIMRESVLIANSEV